MPTYFNDLADIGDDDLGALGLFRRRRKRGGGGGRSMSARRLIPSTPGVPNRGLREQPLPLGSTSFTASSGTSLLLSASPARPFRGRRLILDAVKTGTTGGLVSITALNVGADNQLPVPSGTAMPAAAFAANAVGVNLDMDPAGPGVGVTCQLAISSAPTMTDTVDCSALIIGSTVG